MVPTTTLRFGICTDQNMSWEKTTQRWQRFEELGFDSVWDCDHWIARADEDPRSSLDAFHDLVGRYHEAELPKLRTATL